MEVFKEADIELYNTLSCIVSNFGYQTKYHIDDCFSLSYSSNYKPELPLELMLELLDKKLVFSKLPHGLFQSYFPYKITVHKLERGENPLLQNTHYLGLNHYNGDLDLYLDEDHEHSVVSLLWILLHEFRHKMQVKNPNIESCVKENANIIDIKQFLMEKLEITEDKFNHVFHEYLPYEIDANTFACETLGITYPGSKFNFDEDLLK